MKDTLRFDPGKGTREEAEWEGKRLAYIVYRDLVYVEKPVDPAYQCMNLYMPISWGDRDFGNHPSPILLMNRCGGYMSYRPNGPQRRPPTGLEHRRDQSGKSPRVGPAPGAEGRGRMQPKELLYAALARGIIVALPGNRGRDCVSSQGRYFGKAPAMIVDLKAAIRYLRYNADRIPGDLERIISRGSSAGGGMSALLAASGNDPEYESYLAAIGAAPERDDVFAAVCMSPVFDLEHQDAAYEWQYGKLPLNGFENEERPPVNQRLSRILAEEYETYLRSLAPQGRGAFGTITPENYRDYYQKEFLVPAAERYLKALDGETREMYLRDRPWLSWKSGRAEFSFEDYERYLGRLKPLPAFDSFRLGDSENTAFGTEWEPAAHYTLFSLRQDTGNPEAQLEEPVLTQRRLLNPMTRLREGNGSIAAHWWIRMGSKESGFGCPLVVNLASWLEARHTDVHFRLIWDGGHCAEDDLADQLDWMERITQEETPEVKDEFSNKSAK